MLGTVLEIFSATKEQSSQPRPIVESLDMIEGHGIKNDKFAGKDENRAVMMVGKIAYDIAFENGIILEHGSLGENILLDFDPHELELGDIFVIDDVELEITQKCTVCNHLALFDERLPELVKAHRGLYSKIVKSGRITKEKSVTLKDKT